MTALVKRWKIAPFQSANWNHLAAKAMVGAMIDKLEMFIALAQARHFGRAAEAVGITQPSLSAGIRQLEEQLGVMLVLRGSRFQGLTPEGARALEWARQIVGDTRTMKAELRAAGRGAEGLSGNLRIAAIPTGLTTISALTAAFAATHPNIHVTVTSTNSANILKMLDDLQIDAGLTYLDNEPLGRVVSVPLYDERYVLLINSTHPLAAQDQVSWAEVGKLELCLLTQVMQNRRIIAGHLAEAGAEVSPRVESDSIIALTSHVLHGGLATVLPERAAEIFLSNTALTARPIVRPSARHAVGLVVPYREPHTPVVAALLKAAHELA